MKAALRQSCECVRQRRALRNVHELRCVVCATMVRGHDALHTHLTAVHGVQCELLDNLADVDGYLQHLCGLLTTASPSRNGADAREQPAVTTTTITTTATDGDLHCPVCGVCVGDGGAKALTAHVTAARHERWTAHTIPSLRTYYVYAQEDDDKDKDSANEDDNEPEDEDDDDEEGGEDEDEAMACVCMYCPLTSCACLQHMRDVHAFDLRATTRQRDDVRDEYDVVRLVNTTRRCIAAGVCPWHGTVCDEDGNAAADDKDAAAAAAAAAAREQCAYDVRARGGLEAHLRAHPTHRLPAIVARGDAALLPAVPNDALLSLVISAAADDDDDDDDRGGGFVRDARADPEYPCVPTLIELARKRNEQQQQQAKDAIAAAMPYTHADVEADRKLPAGSLFVQLMNKPHCAPGSSNSNNNTAARTTTTTTMSPPRGVAAGVRSASACARGRRAAPHTSARAYTLANTTLGRYAAAGATARDGHAANASAGGALPTSDTAATPLRGRRHYDVPSHVCIGYDDDDYCNNNHGNGVKGKCAADQPQQRQRPHSARGPPEQLGVDLRPLYSPPPTPRQRRRVCPPGTTRTHSSHSDGDGVGADGHVHNNDNNNAATAAAARRGVEAARHLQRDDHLGLSTLLPREEAAKPRPVPPPLLLPPRHTGIRMFPCAHSARGAHERRRGVRLVGPPPHYRSVAERQNDFLALRVVSPPRQRQEHTTATAAAAAASSSSLRPHSASCYGGGGNVYSSGDGRDAPTQRYRLQRGGNNVNASSILGGCGRDATAATTAAEAPVSARGRSRAAAPPVRTFDIITGQPLYA